MAKKPVKYCVVDAFTDTAFKGNPAAVCMLEEKKEEEWLQSVASEFNLSETCYLTPIVDSVSENANPRFQLRWFTPVAEASPRSGVINLHLDEKNQRVYLRGKAVVVAEGSLLA